VTPIEQLVNIKFDYSYTIKLAPQQAVSPTGTATVSFQVNCPQDRLLVTGSTTDVVTVVPGSPSGTYTGTVNIQITVLREAPGMTPAQCTVTGSVGAMQGAAVPASTTDTDSFQIIPDYLPYIEAQSAAKLRQGGPQKQIPFAIDLTNFGNAATKVSFAIESAPSGKWQGLLPDPALLDPPGGNLQSKQITFNVATPYKNGWNNDEGAFTLSMTPEYQYNSEKTGSPITVTVLARVRGVYVPSLEPMVMVSALLGAAMLIKLRKEDE
ncbi:MAG TPA: hypothetical protein VJ874_03770, partial [Candidatus Thermoplasmatota archaeon]|nr:hypothetical protein [Candidatus Thermoplasmatota archaeon]